MIKEISSKMNEQKISQMEYVLISSYSSQLVYWKLNDLEANWEEG